MNKMLLFLCLVSLGITSLAQNRISRKDLEDLNSNLKDNPLLKDDADFTNTQSNKWNDESAVILCQKTSFNYDKKGVSVGKRIGRNIWGLIGAIPTFGLTMYLANASNETSIIIEESERRKILLKDKYAIDLYSVLYFRMDADKDAFNARVYKTDGSVQNISLEEAVRVENISNVPDVFRSYTDKKFSTYYRPDYYKIVVPDLQEGDILEYEFVNYNITTYASISLKEFSPVYYLCNRSLPVEKQILEVTLQDERYHFGYKNMKGAPSFVKTTGKDIVYRWEDIGREKMPDIRYTNKYIEMPSIKFQVVYAKNSNKDYMFVNNAEDGTKDLADEEFSQKAKLMWFSASDANIPSDWIFPADYYVKTYYKELKKTSVTDNTDDDYVRKMYYFIRSKTFFRSMNDYAFAKVFAGLLEKKNLPYEIVATNSNVLTSINNLAFVREIQWAVKYKNKFYSNPSEHGNPGEIPQWLNGNKAISFTDEKSKPTNIIVPASDTSGNALQYVIRAGLSADNSQLIVDESVQAKGLTKENMMDDILAMTSFMDNDYKNYDGPGMLDNMSERDRTSAEELLAKQKKEWKEAKPAMMKEMLESKYSRDISGDVTFKLVNDGRSYKKPELAYNEKFTLTNMAAKAGNDIVLSAPALIGDQSKIKPEEITRKTIADLSFPRSIKWNISIAIPAGYTVQGLAQLNQSVTNETGSFVSTAEVQGTDLVLQVKKIYNSKYVELPNWPSMVQMLDAAFNWSQLKVVLKKV